MKLRRTLLTLICITGLAACSDNEVPAPSDYEKYIKYNIEFFCEKSIECNSPVIRTLSIAEQETITVQSCIDRAEHNLTKKLAIHTEKMKALSVVCYEQLREAPCKKMLLTQFTSPACLQLRDLSNQAYEKAGFKNPQSNTVKR